MVSSRVSTVIVVPVHTFLPSVSVDECASLQDGIQSFNEDIEQVPMKWFETPSFVPLKAGNIPTFCALPLFSVR